MCVVDVVITSPTFFLPTYVVVVDDGGDSLIEKVATVFGDDDSEIEEFDFDSFKDSLDMLVNKRDLISSMII